MTDNQKKYSMAACVTLLIVASYLSVFTVNIGEQAIVTQFGNVSKLPVTEPGLHLKIPFIHKVHFLPNYRVFELSTGLKSKQLTSYGVVNIEQSIQYEIEEPVKYFVNFGTNLNIKDTITQALKSSLTTELESGALGIDSSSINQKRTIGLNSGAKDKLIEKANSLLNPKGIRITNMEVTIEP